MEQRGTRRPAARHVLPAWYLLLPLMMQVFTASPSAAQTAAQDLEFVSPTDDIRVSGLDIADIAQDSNGFLWFGVRSPLGGLVRFDSYDLKVYTNDDTDPASIVHDEVWVLEVDGEGNLWAGTVVGGLSRYNSSTDDFTQFVHDPNDVTSLPNDDVKSLFVAADGTFWVGTSGGLARLDAETGGFTSYFTASDNPEDSALRAVRSITEDPETGNLWLGTRRNGVIEFDPRTGDHRTFIHDPDDSTSLSNDAVDVAMRDESGRLWFGTRDGLNLLDPTNDTFSRYVNDPGDPTSIAASRVWSIFEDSAGRFWIGHNDGLDLFDVKTNTFVHMPTRGESGPGIPEAGVRTIFEDQAGAIWVGSFNGGVSRLSPTPKNFTSLRHDPEDPSTLSSDIVHGLAADQKGGLWVTTAAGIDYFDGDEFTRYSHDPELPEAWPNQMRNGLVDPSGNLWIGTTSGGLTHYETDTGTFHHYALPAPGDADAVEPRGVDLDGNLWLVSAGHGYVVFDGDTFTYLLEESAAEFNLNAYARGFYLDPDTGDRWFGQPLSRMDASNGEVTTFPRTPGQLVAGDRFDNVVSSISTQADGTLMIGGFGEITRFDRETLTFGDPVGEGSGLPGGWYRTIEVDAAGQHWILSQQAIGRYDPVTGVGTSFDALDGLPVPHYTSLARGTDGTFYVASSTDGVTTFDPSTFIDNPLAPPVVLTSMELFNEPVRPGEGSPLSTSIHETDRVDLNHDQNFIAFTFSALNYDAAEKNQFQYLLEGFDKEWRVASPDRRIATYTGLPPGDYTFRVRASNNSGVWNDDGVSLAVFVSPPWWRTPFAYLAYAILAFGLLYGFVRWRTSAVKRRNRALEERLNERQLAQEERDALLDTLNEHVQQIEGIMDTVPTGIVLLDDNRQVLSSNRVAQADLSILTEMERDGQLSKLGGIPIDEVLRGADAEVWHEVGAGEDDTRRRFVATARQIEVEGEVDREARWVLAWEDVTADRELQAQAVAQQRFADIGQFTTGVAHDMNNILAVIALNGDRLQGSHELSEASERRVNRIVDQTNRAATVLRQILDYSRRDSLDFVTLNASEEVRRFLPVLREAVPGSVTIGVSVEDAGNYWMEGDASSLQQIVLNLVLNAGDALATSVDIELSEIAADECDPSLIRLIVRDDGSGISGADATRIFEPFFSTKPLGKGTGLGLAQVEGLVERHRGTIDLKSAPGEGAAFVMHFPVSEKPVAPKADAPETSTAGGRGRRILAVDDNEDLLDVFVEILADGGYEVTAAKRGADAFELWRQREGAFDLILSDYLMPDMHGGQLINRLHEAGSSIPVIVISGLQDGESGTGDLRAKGLVDWIRKPVDAKELLDKIDRALSARSQPNHG